MEIGEIGGLNAQISLNRQVGITGQSILKPEETSKESTGAGEILGSFGDLLKGQMNAINDLQARADQATETYAVGGDIELHNVILAVEKADMAMQLAMQIRNRIVGAYQEISRMQV
jgi:flagellar hook-basal body complex protein FliE